MENSKIVDRIYARCKKCSQPKRERHLYSFSVVVAIVMIIFAFPYFSSSKLTIHNYLLAFILFTISVLLLYGALQVVNYYRLIYSIRTVKLAIPRIARKDVSWINEFLIKKSEGIDSAILCHPITMDIIGKTLEICHDQRCEKFFSNSKENCYKIRRLSKGQADLDEYERVLNQLVAKDKVFVSDSLFQKIFANKQIKIFTVCCFVIIVLLHFILQIYPLL